MTGRDVMQTAVVTYGKAPQLIVAVEEMSELTKEISKELRGSGKPDHMAEEMADVEIMLAQLRLMFENDRNVDLWKMEKLSRLRERLGIRGEVSLLEPSSGALMQELNETRAKLHALEKSLMRGELVHRSAPGCDGVLGK